MKRNKCIRKSRRKFNRKPRRNKVSKRKRKSRRKKRIKTNMKKMGGAAQPRLGDESYSAPEPASAPDPGLVKLNIDLIEQKKF